MLLFIPVTRADCHLAAPLLNLMLELGGIGKHSMVIAIAHEGVSGADTEVILSKAAKLGPKVYPITMNPTVEYGWPRSPNLIFQEAAIYVANQAAYGEKCWYFFELDNCPLKEGWLDTLQQEYDAGGKPCMGVINKTMRSKRANGGQYQDGEHLVGTGIYPPNIFLMASICRNLHVLHDPFDVALQLQVVPMTHGTTLIQHNWSTKNYHHVGGGNTVAVCETNTSRHTSKDYATGVNLGNPSPVVVHGCKDTSLIQLVLKRHTRQDEEQPTVRMMPRRHRKTKKS